MFQQPRHLLWKFHLDLELMNLIMMIMLLVFPMRERSYVVMFLGQVVGVNGDVMYHCLKLLLVHVILVMEHQVVHVAILVLIIMNRVLLYQSQRLKLQQLILMIM